MPVRWIFLGAVIAGLLAGGAVAAVRTIDTGSPTPTPVVVPTPDLADPSEVAAEFARAFQERDAEAFHALLDDGDAATAPVSRIREIFDNLATESGLRSINATVESATRSRATVSITLSTGYFGDVQYTIDAALTTAFDGNVRIRWSPSLFHPQLDEGRMFEASLERPRRGAIYDRNGTVLAVTQDIRYLGLNRSIISDRAAVTATLESFGFARTAIDAAFDSPLGQNQRVPVGVVGDDRALEANELARQTTGLLIWFEEQRVHPLGAAAAHVVGYTRELTADELEARAGMGYGIGDRVGATGLEAGMDGVLAGQPGGELRIVDPDHTRVTVIASREFVQGADVQTTLDAAVLQRSAALLADRPGASVVMDPRSDAILALNSAPSFDPDIFERNDRAAIEAVLANADQPLTNRATHGLYSAGSTFKLVTGSAGLLSGLYTPSDRINCPYLWDGVDPPRRNWEAGQGMLTIAQGLMRSCNTLFYQVGLSLYNETDNFLSQTARSFGFGAETGVVGLSEEAGLVPDNEWKQANKGEPWYPGDEVNLAIGQGFLLITPLQLANAYTAFLNNALRTPIVVAGQDPGAAQPIGLSQEQWDHLLLGLRLVTSDSGTARTAFALAGYTNFGGKSGTAEDAESQQHVLFVTFAPATAPTALAVVVFDHGQSGSIEAGPVARDMVLEAMQ